MYFPVAIRNKEGSHIDRSMIVLWRVADIATACMFLFRVISL